MKTKIGKVVKRSDGFEMHSTRPVTYSVRNVLRPVFDPAEPTLQEVVAKRPIVIVIDTNIKRICGRELENYVSEHRLNLLGTIDFSGSESDKTPAEKMRIQRRLAALKLPRNGLMISCGGGVTADVTGAAAAEAYRGVPLCRIPTTLIGIVDVAVGIKQAVNLGSSKNWLGSFYPAESNICDLTFLRSLDRSAIAGGFAEIIKMGLIRDPRLFQLVEAFGAQLINSRFQEPIQVSRQVIERAQFAMMKELAPNLYEHDRRRTVDLGHTFSQVIEACSGYAIPHGQAVGIDILYSTRIAVRRGLCPFGVLDRLLTTYASVGLPCDQSACNARELMRAVSAARRHRGSLNLVVPLSVGRVDWLQDVLSDELEEAVEFFRHTRAA